MKLIKSFEKEDLSTKLDENKDLLLPVGVLAAGIFLFLFLILPQILSFSEKISQRNAEIARLDEIKAAKKTLANTSEAQLISQEEAVANALPIDKNFEAIFNAISSASNLSNTQIAGYVFSDSASPASEEGTSNPSRTLKFTLSIDGTPDQAALFIEELYKTGPISGVNKIDFIEGQTDIEIDFFYKPFTALDKNSFLPTDLTPEQLKIYEEIKEFSRPSSEPVFDFPQEASDSSQLSESEEN